jgi:hypothetical protein
MNYFTHAVRFLDEPYFLAGGAVPDWLSVVDRRVRVSTKSAMRFAGHPDPRVAAVARGTVQHHHDDAWFHRTPAFSRLNLEFSARLRQWLPADDGFRPSFLGHILVEILLDAALVEQRPDQLDRYYGQLDALDAAAVGQAVDLMANRPIPQLAAFIPLFSAERFLYDYADDGKLLGRLNRVLKRVGLPALADSFLDFLPYARQRVEQERLGLLDDPAWHAGPAVGP